MKVLIVVDMEGITGIERAESPEKGVELMTAEVLSVVKLLTALGTNDITICDAHDRGENIERKLFVMEDVQVVSQVWNVDFIKGYDVALLIGFHGMAGSDSLSPHTLREDIAKVERNGMEIGEVGILINWLREYNVPTVFVSGDKQATKEALMEEPTCVTYTIGRDERLQDVFFQSSNEFAQKVDSLTNNKLRATISQEELYVYVKNRDAISYIRAKDKVRDGYLRFESYSELLSSMYNICEDLNNAMNEIVKKNTDFIMILRNDFGNIDIQGYKDNLFHHLLSKNVYTLEEPDREYIMKALKSILSH